ncbi:hypothetical protein LJK88_44620 [Paenibacillus sp. P26]|nr:hypothetical protein LJK88_44620 [Paenibacillus sp. P26]
MKRRRWRWRRLLRRGGLALLAGGLACAAAGHASSPAAQRNSSDRSR